MNYKLTKSINQSSWLGKLYYDKGKNSIIEYLIWLHMFMWHMVSFPVISLWFGIVVLIHE